MAKVDLDVKAGYPALGREEGVFEIEVDTVTDVYGVNKDLMIDDEGDVNYRAQWNVTHMPTGLAMVRGLPSRKAAKAVARILQAGGYDAITTDDPNQLAREAAAMGLSDLKLWIRDQQQRSRSTDTFVRRLEQRAGARPRAAKRREPRKKKPAKKRGKKKAAKKRAAAKKREPERPQAYVDLLEMARRARR